MTNKEKLIKKSLELIHKKGFKATTMRDLADQMGYKVSNIYNFIDSKQSLLENSLFSVSKEFHKGIDDILKSGYDAEEKLKEVISLHIRMTVERPYEIALHVNEWRHLSDEKVDAFQKERKVYQEKVKLIVEEGINQGIFVRGNPDVITHTVMSTVRWIYSWYIDREEEINPLELERVITGIIMNGIAVREAEITA